MKNIKRVTITGIFFLAIVFFTREWIYYRVVTYRSIGRRIDYPAVNPLLIGQIEAGIEKQNPPDVFGTNIHKYLNFPFLKDHDFVIIENAPTGEVFSVDSTMNDYLKIGLVRYAS